MAFVATSFAFATAASCFGSASCAAVSASSPRKGVPCVMRFSGTISAALPAKSFAGPGRSYPVEDKAHARSAKSRVSAAEHSGRMSKSEEAKIDARANKVLGKGKKK